MQCKKYSSVFLKTFSGALLLVGSLYVTTTAAAAYPPPPTACKASKSWITSPNPPQEIPNGSNADLCDFYQFSWQWFLQLTSPSKKNPSLRNFQVAADYPILEGKLNGVQQNSCDASVGPTSFFVRIGKLIGPNGQFVIPQRIGQAGGGDTIYDQNGNVVYYSINFSRNLCNVPAIQAQPNFPSGTTEIKTAWRVITDKEKPRYFWMTANVDGVLGTELLGLVGFHLVRATTLHPEFIWATFEHKDNVPDCVNPQTSPANGWSFTSAACAQALAKGGVAPITCDFNVAAPAKSLTGTPSEICRVHPDGTAPTDLEAAQNIADIDALNQQLVGAKGYLTALSISNPMAVWKNYINVGALWENDTKQPSSNFANQRGSLHLANTVMETTFQDFKTSQFESNCFGCHHYEVATSNTEFTAGLSHIFDDIMVGQCTVAHDVQAGPIWSNADAQNKCPNVCEAGGWNGQWTTTVWGQESVCGCCGSSK